MSKYPFSQIEPKWQKFWDDNKTFKYNRGVLKLELIASVLRPRINNRAYNNYLEAYYDGHNATAAFNATRFTPQEWATLTK